MLSKGRARADNEELECQKSSRCRGGEEIVAIICTQLKYLDFAHQIYKRIP